MKTKVTKHNDYCKSVNKGLGKICRCDGAPVSHTPTPWHQYDGEYIRSGDRTNVGHDIAQAVSNNGYRSVEEIRANAAYIVKAVNLHEEMLAALKDVFYNTKSDSPDMWARVSLVLAKADLK